MTRTYAPTINPGDTRTRCRYLGVWNPLNAAPRIDILEQEVVRLADGETVLRDTNGLSAGLDGSAFTLRDPATDAPLAPEACAAIAAAIASGTATDGMAMVLVYSWTRYQQEARDAREAAAQQGPQQ